MTRQATGFSIFCLIASVISLLYLLVYHIWLRPYELSHYLNLYSGLYSLLFYPLLCLCAPAGLISFLGNLFLRRIPAGIRMLLLILPIFFLLIYLCGVLFMLAGSDTLYSLMLLLRNPLCFALAGVLFGFGTVR